MPRTSPFSHCNGFALLSSQPAECVKQGPLNEEAGTVRDVDASSLKSWAIFGSGPPLFWRLEWGKGYFQVCHFSNGIVSLVPESSEWLHFSLCRETKASTELLKFICPKSRRDEMVFLTFLYRKLSTGKTAFALSTKCRVRQRLTQMSSSVRDYDL